MDLETVGLIALIWGCLMFFWGQHQGRLDERRRIKRRLHHFKVGAHHFQKE